MRAFHDIALTLATGLLDEYYSPVQVLALLTAIDIYTMSICASRDSSILASAAAFLDHLHHRRFPEAYAEALALPYAGVGLPLPSDNQST